MIDTPKPEIAEILKTLQYLLDPSEVVELRAFHRGGRKRTDAGYFDVAHWNALAAAAVNLCNQGASVYITINPVAPQLLSRYNNRVEPYARATTTDAQITKRRWLPIDIDPQRPAGTSATQTQLELAAIKADEIRKHLAALGWPSCAAAVSGNGMHLLYAIDMPNDAPSKKLIERVLEQLAAKFDTDAVKVDRSVYNASRIWKLYGTVANKGDHTEAAPWRLAKLADSHIPKRVLVPVERLQALASIADRSQGATKGLNIYADINSHVSQFDLGEFMLRHGLEHAKDIHEGTERFKLARCPFNPEHVKGEAAIFRRPTGALAFKCMHNSCADKVWRNVRELYDGSKRQHIAAISPQGTAPQTEHNENEWSWEQPQPLSSDLPTVAHFRPDLLPEALRGWVLDIAERMQCPPDFPAVGALVALSSLIGPRRLIAPKKLDTWTVTPNLWGLIVGNPGVMKSPALSEALAPLNKMAADMREVWETERSQWLVSKKAHEMGIEQSEKNARSALSKNSGENVTRLLKADPAPSEPVLRRLIVNDTNAAALGEILESNPWGVLAFRDEIYGLLKSMDREGQEGDRAFYLQGFDGDKPYTFDRIGRGLNRHIKRVCISMLGSIQPGRLMEYVRGAVAGGSGDDGLMQRFQLAVWPDTPPTWRNVDREPDQAARRQAHAVYARLASLIANDEYVPVWRFNPDAQELFDKWRSDLEPRIRSEEMHPAMAAHLSKYRKLIPSLALIFALIDTPENNELVGKVELVRAMAWGEYLETHAMRMYSAAVTPETAAAKALLRKIKDGTLSTAFSLRDVYRNNWQHLRTAEATRRACEVLTEFHWIRPLSVPASETGGRPTVIYCLNPLALVVNK